METSNEQIAKQLCQLIEAAHGHALVLFTSYEQMGEVYELLKDALDLPILQARRGSQAVVEQFKQLANGVLLAGGSCWEGIDFPGDLVSLLVIMRLPFPVPDPVREARREQYLTCTATSRPRSCPKCSRSCDRASAGPSVLRPTAVRSPSSIRGPPPTGGTTSLRWMHCRTASRSQPKSKTLNHSFGHTKASIIFYRIPKIINIG